MSNRIECINCHSIFVLPLCVLGKLLTACTLIYEPHELEVESVAVGKKYKFFFKITERILINFADKVCVVNDSIADWYSHKYKLRKIWVVRNISDFEKPGSAESFKLRKCLNLSVQERLFIYQGLLAPGRSISILLEAFAQLRDKHIVFMGYGPLKDRIVEYSNSFNNVHFLDAVQPEELPFYTPDADVGFSLIENICLSYYLSLPNKVFEYSSSNVPQVVSPFPEMVKFVKSFDTGWVG